MPCIAQPHGKLYVCNVARMTDYLSQCGKIEL